MKGTIQKWKLVILLDALLFLSNMTFAKDTINQYTEGNPIDTTAVSISDKTNIPRPALCRFPVIETSFYPPHRH